MRHLTYPYAPDYAASPGDIFAEHLDARGISASEFPASCGLAPSDIDAIVAAERPVDAEMARPLESALGVDARIWLGLEEQWQRRGRRRVDDDLRTATEPSSGRR